MSAIETNEKQILEATEKYVHSMRVMQNCLQADPEQDGLFTRRAIASAQEDWNVLDALIPRPEGL